MKKHPIVLKSGIVYLSTLQAKEYFNNLYFLERDEELGDEFGVKHYTQKNQAIIDVAEKEHQNDIKDKIIKVLVSQGVSLEEAKKLLKD